MKPTPVQPRIIMAYVEGSGTAAAVGVGAAASTVILSRIRPRLSPPEFLNGEFRQSSSGR